MTEDSSRSVGAIIGLVLGLGLMFLIGFGGMIPGAIFGAGGAVAGGITGEKLYAKSRR